MEDGFLGGSSGIGKALDESAGFIQEFQKCQNVHNASRIVIFSHVYTAISVIANLVLTF